MGGLAVQIYPWSLYPIIGKPSLTREAFFSENIFPEKLDKYKIIGSSRYSGSETFHARVRTTRRETE
jgi:hypothetical protein